MKLKTPIIPALVLALLLSVSCQQERPHYVIGISQCSEDTWREKQNGELRMGNYFHNNVELRFAAAGDSDQRQIEQIDSLVACGIDLLIVAPNQVNTINPAIDRAYDSGIPVIVFERKTNSRKYTAFMSADNYEMGRQMGEYIAKRLGGRGRVLEVMGLKGSSPAIDRPRVFTDAVSHYPQISRCGHAAGRLDRAERLRDRSTRELQGQPDVASTMVFAMNDRSAIGARQAFQEAGDSRPLYCGIDGLPGKNGGITLVNDSVLDASFIYPTNGDLLLQLAVDILEGRPYKKETLMMSAIVTRANARVLFMQTEEIMRQRQAFGPPTQDGRHLPEGAGHSAHHYLDGLRSHRAADCRPCAALPYYIGKADTAQRKELPIPCGIGTEHRPAKRGAGAGRSANKREQRRRTGQQGERKSRLRSMQRKERRTGQREARGHTASLFITRFRSVVEARLSDSELSVENLAADMHLSRVQLYRKVKAVSGSTPNELLRSARLKRAYQLLLTTDKSISEVAYLVGFTAPSYFTKCFKEEYGQLPGEIKKVWTDISSAAIGYLADPWFGTNLEIISST